MKIVLTLVLCLAALADFCHAQKKMCKDLHTEKFPFHLLKTTERFELQAYRTLDEKLKCQIISLQKIDDTTVEGYVGSKTPMFTYTKIDDFHYNKTHGTTSETIMCLKSEGEGKALVSCFYSCNDGGCIKSLNCFVKSTEGLQKVEDIICELKEELKCFKELKIERCEKLTKEGVKNCE